MPQGRDKGELSVLRTEDVPLQEVSGVCLRREAGGDMAMVAFGDRTSITTWVELPSDDRGAVWLLEAIDLADVEGSQIPHQNPVEAVCADGAGRILILRSRHRASSSSTGPPARSSRGSRSRSRPGIHCTTPGSTPRARRAKARRSCGMATS